MRVLYVSQTGMLEGLGQSQVLAYLRGLARRGAEIDLVSFEQAAATTSAIDELHGTMTTAGIGWHPLRRARDPRLRVKIREAALGVAHVLRLAHARRPQIIHGRSSLATAIGDAVARTLPSARLLFDCRGMVGEEYLDTGYWTKDRIEYRLVTRYERAAFKHAAGVVVLTRALRAWLREQQYFGPRTLTEVVPCCVDLERFRFSAESRKATRAELGLADDELAIVYAGSLGSFYREADMARFAAAVRARSRTRRVRFVALTPSAPELLVNELARHGIADPIVKRVAPARMPEYLSAGDLGLSFIISAFSKMGSSPTKVAEYFACGLPVVLNGDIGDQAELEVERDAAVVLRSFGDLDDAADRALALAERPIEQRVEAGARVARERFDLEGVGVRRYELLYRALSGSSGSRS